MHIGYMLCLCSHGVMSGNVFLGVEGFASSTVILWILSCFLLCQEESKVDSAFQPVLQHHCCGKLLQRMSVGNFGWLIRVWKELLVAAHVQGVSWRKQEECG